MTEPGIENIIQANVAAVKQEIQDSCDRAKRCATDVTLVAVTKYAQWDWVQALARVHQCFGESRPQQLAERCVQMPDAEWHLIGQLQRNKVRSAIQGSSLIHSVDSMRLLERIALVAGELGHEQTVLLQVNVSKEESKSGFAVDELRNEFSRLTEFENQIHIAGLMTMAPATNDPENARPFFRELRNLRDELNESYKGNLIHLSMGMSGDFSIAIEEGATLVRVGSRLFQGLSSDA